MSPAGPLLVAWALAAGGSAAQSPAREIDLQVTPGAREVELGKGFPLTVVRVWSRGLVPRDWSDEALAPLVVRLVETTRREAGGRIAETRSYLAYAFRLESVTIPAIVFRAMPADGGRERVAMTKEIPLRVRGSLDPAAPGPPELPGPLLEEPSHGQPEGGASALAWLAGGISALAGSALLLWHLRRRRAANRTGRPAAPAAEPPDPEAGALERLRHLGEWAPEGPAEEQTYHLEATSLMREYLRDRFELRPRERTSQELLADSRSRGALPPSLCSLLEEYLTRCDLVRFGRCAAKEADRRRLLEGGEGFVRGARSGGGARAPDAGSFEGGGLS